MNKNKGFAPALVLLIVLGIAVVGGIAYYTGKNSATVSMNNSEINNHQPNTNANTIITPQTTNTNKTIQNTQPNNQNNTIPNHIFTNNSIGVSFSYPSSKYKTVTFNSGNAGNQGKEFRGNFVKNNGTTDYYGFRFGGTTSDFSAEKGLDIIENYNYNIQDASGSSVNTSNGTYMFYKLGSKGSPLEPSFVATFKLKSSVDFKVITFASPITEMSESEFNAVMSSVKIY
jgi:hypothetical protein